VQAIITVHMYYVLFYYFSEIKKNILIIHLLFYFVLSL